MTRHIEIASEMMVAHAAPATPICRLMTKNRSRKILRIDVAIKIYKGVFASPTACRIPVPAL